MFDDFKADEASQSRGDEVVPGLPPGEVPCVMNGATTGAKTGAKTGDEPDETLDVIPTAGAQSGRATEVNATRASAKEGHDSRLKRPLSKRSGGPRSRDGKAVASGNSLKHGAYSTRPVQLDLYHQKLNGIFDELSPSGVIAKTLCGDVAHSLAKLETINTYQRDLIYSAQHDGVSLSELARRLDFPWAQTHLVMLAEPPAQAVLQSQLARSWRTLARPPKSLAGVTRGDDLSAPMKPVKGATKLAPCPASEGIEIGNSAGCPSQDGQLTKGPRNSFKPSSKNGGRALVHSNKAELVPMADLRAARLYETGCDVFARPWLGVWEHEHFLQQVDLVMVEAAQGQGYVGARVMERGETTFLVLYWLLRNLQRLNECLAQIKNKRTMEVLLDDKVERARSHVQRGLRESLGNLQVTRELRWGPHV